MASISLKQSILVDEMLYCVKCWFVRYYFHLLIFPVNMQFDDRCGLPEREGLKWELMCNLRLGLIICIGRCLHII